jgi:hypothetical protein
MNKQLLQLIKLISVIAFVSACTKSRKAELPEEQQSSVFAIGEFGTVGDKSDFKVAVTSALQQKNSLSPLALDPEGKAFLQNSEVSVPERMKFMFNEMPLMNMQTRQFEIVFTVDREYVTVYKVAPDVKQLTVLEKTIATTSKELKNINEIEKAAPGQMKGLTETQTSLRSEKMAIRSGQKAGVLLVPLFKYKIEAYCVIERQKNERKENTARLQLKSSEWKDATHIQLSDKTDNRRMTGMSVEQTRQLKRIFAQDKIDNQLMTSEEFQQRFAVGMRFVEPQTQIFTRLDAEVMHVYEVTKKSELNDSQRRLLKNNAGNEEVVSCQDPSVASFINSSDPECVLVLKADVPIAYKNAKLNETNSTGSTSEDIVFEDVSRANSVGLVEIKENVVAKQVDVTGALDPNSAIKISDIQGEFFYRRTFEAASNMFLGRTGTSGDMVIIRFELEDDRIVVRNQMSLITYTGQGPKDREELMSFPVKYVRMVRTDAQGSPLTVPTAQQTTKEKAEYAIVDWTKNTIPDSTSPLAFYADGACLMATSSLNVTDMDMRLATAGILNYSLSGSYTVNPTLDCVATKETNSMISGISFQFNFNIKERISFMKHKDPQSDIQFAENISNTQQGAFNFGLFTLADLINGEEQMVNRDGSEKYMPMVHDFRNGKKVIYHLGGINNPDATSPERRQVLVEAAQQVIAEWNKTLHYSFKGTPLERASDQNYLELIIDDANTETHLGDLDRNYIWFQELPAENGLLGVAQPAANPRSGIIQSSNAIVYTGNSFNAMARSLKLTKLGREYERNSDYIKNRSVKIFNQKREDEAELKRQADKKKQQDALAASGDSTVPTDPSPVTIVSALTSTGQQTQSQVTQARNDMIRVLQNMKLTNRSKKISMGRADLKSDPARAQQIMASLVRGNILKPQKVRLETSQNTFVKKLTELSVNQELAAHPYQFELAVNQAFIQYGNLSNEAKQDLQKQSQLLAAAVRFEQSNSRRPGCFYQGSDRNGINDEASTLDQDPHQNLMKNFKKTVMSTLSHELGHAIGLHHNFKASSDKANYKFSADEAIGRNYSSIMDYMPDIDMNYAGPGPYDAHAMRAGYTGLVELSKAALASPEIGELKLTMVNEKFVSMKELMQKMLGGNSYVHLTKDTFNKIGLLKYYEQCDDTGLGLSTLCRQFDVGGSAVEIVQNAILDYTRSYANRYFIYDKINFSSAEKMQIVSRNINTFQHIRSFLDEAFTTFQRGAGRPANARGSMLLDQLTASRIGYEFFHELIRIPTTKAPVMRLAQAPEAPVGQCAEKIQTEEKALCLEPDATLGHRAECLAAVYAQNQGCIDALNDKNRDGFVADDRRFNIIQMKENGKEEADFKLVESRSSFDIRALGGDRDKLNTIGLTFDKSFAMAFLMQASSAPSAGELQNSQISYTIFEKAVLGQQNPSDSLTISTLFDILNDNLTYGFFLPTEGFQSVNFEQRSTPIPISYKLSEDSAVAAIASLAESKQSVTDFYSETFKFTRSPEASAPKDRLNITKPGQKRGLGDTKVYFASQNAISSYAMIAKAARNEFYVANQVTLFSVLRQLYENDAAAPLAYEKMIKEACQENPAGAECIAAQNTPLEQFLAEPQNIALAAAGKAKADEIAANFVAQLRRANIKDLLLSSADDKPESEINFSNQVEQLRTMLVVQIGIIKTTVKALNEDSKADIEKEGEKLGDQFASLNGEAEGLPLLATGFAFIGHYTDSDEMIVALPDGRFEKGSFLANYMMYITKVVDDYNMQLEMIDKLATYSSIVDADTVLQ